jgi:hypothetical protein
MRWQFVDHIETFDPWVSIRGRKCISLEEYHLLARFDRTGVLPESLVLESFVHLGRWLVAASSEFSESALLDEVLDFSFTEELGMGSTLAMEMTVQARQADSLLLICRGWDSQHPVSQGILRLSLHALGELSERQSVLMLWRELNGKTE